eukprot:7835384-Pyramimonas_sp.AAC.1
MQGALLFEAPLKLSLKFRPTVGDGNIKRTEIADPRFQHGPPGALRPSGIPGNHLETGPVADDIEIANDFRERRNEE